MFRVKSKMRIEKIIRSKRRTVSLQITDNLSLIIKAPLHLSESDIEKIISKHQKWIDKKEKEIRDGKIRIKPKPKKFIDGEHFYYLGKKYSLRFSNISSVKIDNGFLLMNKRLKNPSDALKKWYKDKAYKFIRDRVDYYAWLLDLQYNGIKITSARKRWGSCTSNRNLNFSWRLIMTPEMVIDYVVVHEIVHLQEMNHSKHFWQKVGKIIPDYKDIKRWLRKNEYLFVYE